MFVSSWTMTLLCAGTNATNGCQPCVVRCLCVSETSCGARNSSPLPRNIYVLYIHICIYRDYSFICGRHYIHWRHKHTHLKRYDARVFALEQRMQRSPRCMNCALVHGLAGWCQHTVSFVGLLLCTSSALR